MASVPQKCALHFCILHEKRSIHSHSHLHTTHPYLHLSLIQDKNPVDGEVPVDNFPFEERARAITELYNNDAVGFAGYPR